MTSEAPSGWLPNVGEVQVDPYGAWAEVGGAGLTYRGELLATNADELYLLPPGSTEIRRIRRADIENLRLFWFDARWEAYAVWSTLGGLATISNGFFLILSAPTWAGSGLGVTRERNEDPLVEYPEASWTSLTKYARYPQGMPTDIERLSPRPTE